MKRYLMKVEMQNGTPGGDSHWSNIYNEDRIVKELTSLISEFEHFDEDSEINIEDTVKTILEDKYYLYEQWGYGIKLEITLEEVE